MPRGRRRLRPEDTPSLTTSSNQASIQRGQAAIRQLATELNYLYTHEPSYYYQLKVAIAQARSTEDLLKRMNRATQLNTE